MNFGRLVLRSPRRPLLFASIATITLRIATIAFMLLSNLWIARNLNKSDAGIYMTLYSGICFSALLGQLGLRTVVVRWIAESTAIGRLDKVRSAILVTSFLVHRSFLAIICAVLTGYCVMINFGFDVMLSKVDMAFAVVWLGTLGIQYTLPEIFRGREEYLLAGVLGGALSNGLGLAGLMSVRRFTSQPELTDALAAMAVAGIVNYLIVMLILARTVRRMPPVDVRKPCQALKASLPILGTQLSTGALTLVDTFLVGVLAGPAQAAL